MFSSGALDHMFRRKHFTLCTAGPVQQSRKPLCVHVIKGQKSFECSRPPELNVVQYKLWSVLSKSQGT